MSITATLAAITGMGVVTPVATGIIPFTAALQAGSSHFSILEVEHQEQQLQFPVAAAPFALQEQIAGLGVTDEMIKKIKRLRNISTSIEYGVYSALEAWQAAGLDKHVMDPERIAMVAAGTNTQQATQYAVYEKYNSKLQFINPVYALNFFDTDLVGVLSELLTIKGEGQVSGAASASGNMAVIQGARLISSGEYDVVMVVAPLMDLSIFEYQALTAIGAMASVKPGTNPAAICRPFDTAHAGFVYGRSAGCLILEAPAHAAKRGQAVYGSIAGYGLCMDANRNPNPSAAGEQRAMENAMRHAKISPAQIDYVNTHGTASPTGDEIEVAALLAAGLENVKANSTKSLIGHGLSAAGLVECIAALIQLKEGFLHPSLNLQQPVAGNIQWITGHAQTAGLQYAINNSFGFGGINTSIILKK